MWWNSWWLSSDRRFLKTIGLEQFLAILLGFFIYDRIFRRIPLPPSYCFPHLSTTIGATGFDLNFY